jgi:hypothetical protein
MSPKEVLSFGRQIPLAFFRTGLALGLSEEISDLSLSIQTFRSPFHFGGPMSMKQGNQSPNPDAENLSPDAANLEGAEGSSQAIDKDSLSQTQGVTGTGSIKVTG